MTVDTGGDSTTTVLRSEMSIVLFGGLASMEAGAVHAAAAGIHAEHRQLAQIFIVVAALQLGVGLWAVVRSSRAAAWAVVAVNVGAIGGWLYTRLAGISWIEGLEVREAPQFADTACAILAAVAVFAAYTGAILPPERRQRRGLVAPAVILGMFAVWTMLAAGTHVHNHAEAADGHTHGTEGVADASGALESADGHTHTADESTAVASNGHSHSADASAAASDDGHDHGADGSSDGQVHIIDPAAAPAAEPAALAWPRPWDPSQPIDLSGVPGVTPEQQQRAIKLVQDTLADLPRFADPAAAIAAGYSSIGDGGTGSEHFIKTDLIEDDDLLDPLAPESLVYSVENGQRTLAGAMYIASARPADDPSLTDWAGPLMTWHKHDNLCWSVDENGAPKVVGIIDANGNCANGVRTGDANPMVHVWIQPHPCGVFAALEGIGAGTAAVPEDQRVDMCSAEHDHGGAAAAPAAVAKPYDPSLPIDLSGTPGVTPQQQAAAENLIAVTLVELPQWSDYRVAEAAGFKSIGDGGTGHEHFVQWDWIEDDVILDPNFPESLVYEPQPDGSKKLVSAMYMTASTVALEDVPDIGGALMQWHIHNNLCYSGWPEHPRVASVTSPNGGCPNGFVNPPPAPMIHVWIVPQECGPFAALEGVGAGQIESGAERLCDTAHGGH